MASHSTSLPAARPIDLGHNTILQPPLSRCGKGPGLLIIRPSNLPEDIHQKTSLDPEPLQKWAEESYAVAQVTLDLESSSSDCHFTEKIGAAVQALISLVGCTREDKFGILIYGSESDYEPFFTELLLSSLDESAVAGIVYHGVWNTDTIFTKIPSLVHLPGPESDSLFSMFSECKQYTYPDVSSSGFIIPGHPHFKYSAASVAHTRTLTFLKPLLNGPYFDLEKIWEEHTYYEFGDRSVEKTMATMVEEPYVNHIPTMTGGMGRSELSNFYRNHFIFKNPQDTKLELVSRTVGIDRVVDEFVACLTHDQEIDWLLPNIPPTHKPLRIPCTSVVNIRGDRLYHEHISWDQATVLMQLDLLPRWLPFPYELPGGLAPAPGKKFEVRTPALGLVTAEKLMDGLASESNELMLKDGVREVDA
ncbi:uncharacterized protein BO80DRAFT_401218 [Aspergillus ibericus CBS 121593]|uniref:Carboxymethylenebutenolidase n=1 Tax=Aspergillus ibericus CBS 121593 TaxID=1448316 RepID=A0A395H8F7_9EURO|nr:carboxymethylenebutenolidase [Aspergillus ibericus CBS 121593]RAL03906.1 carboxymethylenebutenolidase [Aspergillus ibericus CBS 121593]